MDNKEFAERASRLKDIGKVIEALPPEIRSDAFTILKDYVCPHKLKTSDQNTARGDVPNEGEDNLFTRFDHDKPSDNARLIAAHFFQEYGSEAFSTDEVREVAANVGITIPERVDMTYANALEGGKQLFMRAGRGGFKPTVYGEAFLKTTYNVKKGTKKRLPESK